MQVTSTDALAMAFGAVAVVLSGFVLAHSAWGGLAVLAAGALALAIAPIRGRFPAAAPAVWIGFLLLLSVGVAGFLVGFGAFDAPAVEHDAEATLHDAGTDDATVVVTGTVHNVGDGPADTVAVEVTLLDADGEAVADDTVRVEALGAGTRQQFFVRFGPDEGMSAFEAVDIAVEL